MRAQTFGNGVSETRSYETDGLLANLNSSGSEGSAGPVGDGDVPTLPEWAAIILGMLLFSIVCWRQRPAKMRALQGAMLALVLFSGTSARGNETLTYDENGNIASKVTSQGTTTFGYDALNRLQSEAGPAATQTITYDPNGNRTGDATGTHTYTPNTDRQATLAGQGVTLDAAGNITQARGYTYVWNQAGQLKEVRVGAAVLASYFYDYRGRRSRKVTTASAPQGAQTIIYHYDREDRLIAETTPAGTPIVT